MTSINVDNYWYQKPSSQKLSTMQPYNFSKITQQKDLLLFPGLINVINIYTNTLIHKIIQNYQHDYINVEEIQNSYQHVYKSKAIQKDNFLLSTPYILLITLKNSIELSSDKRINNTISYLYTFYQQLINSYFETVGKEKTIDFHNELINNVDKFVMNNSKSLSTQIHVDNLSSFTHKTEELSTLKGKSTHFLKNEYPKLLITELMIDPKPSIGLAECEYIEIYNSTNKKVNLEGYSLIVRDTEIDLPYYIVEPHQYILLVPQNKSELYSEPHHIRIEKWKNLLNTSGEIVLEENNSNKVQYIHYTQEHYRDTQKKNGGWSLEMIDPNAVCKEMDNWKASKAIKGGTPAQKNSVNDSIIDTEAPLLIDFFLEENNSIVLEFNEKIDRSLSHPIFNSYPKISGYQFVYNNSTDNKIEVKISDTLQFGVEYNFQIDGIRDCFGNSQLQKFEIIFEEEINELSLFISEILFNPKSNQSEFLEVYNTSDKPINLKNWMFRNQNEQIKVITYENLIIAPNSFLLFATDILSLKNEYPTISNKNWLEVSIPSLSNNGGFIQLLTPHGHIHDQMSFDESMHSILITDTKGVSLEKINITASSKDANNWSSASSNVNYATPGYQNSQNAKANELECLQITPSVFSPNGNGYKDHLYISINCEKNQSITLQIFNAQGQLIKTLGNNLWTPSNLELSWDGHNENGNLVKMGRYLLLVTLLNENGQINTLQHNIVVSQGL
ncbi:lamin tail domain-containing protein [Sediminitomix flava]|nr:lamin tail domain-containing protein [Sediminitomix flava]